MSAAMNKVLQAVHRCIRSGTDRAMAVLLDDRSVEFKYRRFLPRDLTQQAAKDPGRELVSFCEPSQTVKRQ